MGLTDDELKGGSLGDRLTDILERVRQGDETATAELVARFAGSALRLAEALVGDHHRADDVTQEAFIRALQRLPQLKNAAAFPGWFRQIVRSEANRLTRRREERPAATHELEAAYHSQPSDDLESRERHRQVRDALASLSVANREATELYYLRQLNIAEVAAALNVPQGTVKRRLHDARNRLRNLLLAPGTDQKDEEGGT